MLPQELLPCLIPFVMEEQLFVLGVLFPPFQVKQIKSADLADALSSEGYRELVLTTSEPQMNVSGHMELSDKNPGMLRITLETPNVNRLRQSQLSARTTDPKILKTWQKLAACVKSHTKAGVTVENPKTKKTVFNRTFRYSHGAEDLASKGVIMLPVAGSNVVHFSSDAKNQ